MCAIGYEATDSMSSGGQDAGGTSRMSCYGPIERPVGGDRAILSMRRDESFALSLPSLGHPRVPDQICKQLGGTIDDSELVRGMVFEKGAKKSAGGPTRVEQAKVRATARLLGPWEAVVGCEVGG